METEVERAGGVVPREVLAECLRLEAMEPEERSFDADDFARISGARTLDPHARRVLRELFILRDDEARTRNLPPFKVLPNHALLELARVRPADQKELRSVRALPSALAARHGRRILEAIQAASAMEPIFSMPSSRNGRMPMRLNDIQQNVYEQLRRWRKARAEQRPTDPSHILARMAMARIALESPTSLDELHGTGLLEAWRLDEYGAEILSAVQRGCAEGGRPKRRGR
jgi:ribonuclease D